MLTFPLAALGEQVVLAQNNAPIKANFETGEELENDDGTKQFQIQVIIPTESTTEIAKVWVPAKQNPVQDFKPLIPVKFENLQLKIGKLSNGGQFYSFCADSVKKA